MGELRFTILGCGSSGGVPRLGGHWGECDPDNPRNTRRRCSLLIEREGEGGITRILVDSSPDLRAQLLDAGVGALDAVVYTHSHADHVHGIDDLRMIVFNMRQRLPVWADGDTQNALYARFGYAFTQPEDSPYPPILDMHTIDGPFEITGAGGTVALQPFEVNHGSIEALGFRVNDFAYLPDVAAIPEDVWPVLEGLDCWVLDALRRTPHPTHAHLARSLEWIARAAPRRGILTNMHIDMDYQTLVGELPEHITPAYDGLTIRYSV
ncbi:phosphoribosyl 1,2-cyclic phosphate phosphodiesterase [Roseovarius lutimaris]|uniref:Phosphoribosyl 1,2-cyclic phosphate phosphodiesterase n=1 Tax=Roseovarius lutimaris TaxID=1005928 RepID=A0A1I5B1B9_9RHOB|nr:MBL fold metallo-hydrolase [Roseovarius lutimaris]SFN68462.1 phosphoribosyl 1,2-cyclic phosphate phosphodiesterase [Roseovarius lutimaris]